MTRQYARCANCPIDVYIASDMQYRYPYKLVKPTTVSPGVADSCETLIMDSGIGDDTITNQDVLDLADQYDADMVVAKDYLHDQQQTTASIYDFLDSWKTHNCRATPLIPLQPPHHEHYQELSDQYHYLLGGMAFNYGTQNIIRAVERFRDIAGPSPYVHLLGVGADARLLEYLAQNPGHVQAIDCSTPEQCAINSSIYDVNLDRRSYPVRTGEGSSRTRECLAQHLAYTLNDAIRRRFEREHSTQKSLTAFADSHCGVADD